MSLTVTMKNRVSRYTFQGLCIVSLLAVMALLASAQKSNGDILGTVTDPTGAIVPGATITITNEATGDVRTAVTDEIGNYRFPFLPPGSYRVRAERAGFRAIVVSKVMLTVNTLLRRDLHLEVGEVTDTVSVTAEAVQVNAENPSLGSVVDERRLKSLPLAGRAFLKVAELSAGAVNVSAPGVESNATTTGGGRPGMAVEVSGVREGSNELLFDGIQSKSDYQNMVGIQPTPDSIAEVKVQYGFSSAEYGLPAAVHVITKSGTNEVHGAVWEFFRNDKLDARSTYDLGKAPLRYNQFGGAGGGPIVKNKVFIFGDYEGLQVRQSSTGARAIVPTAAMLNGDFRAISTPISDPLTYNPATGTRQPFPGNVIPPNRISEFAQKYKEFIPAPTPITDGVFNLIGNSRRIQEDAKFSVRGDWIISGKDSLFGRFSLGNSTIRNTSIIPYSGRDYPLNARNVSVSWTHTVGPKVVNDFRFGLDNASMRNGAPENATTNPDFPTLLGLKNLNTTPECNGLAQVGMVGLSGFGNSATCEVPSNNNLHFINHLSINRGRHQITVGGQILLVRKRDVVSDGSQGSISFSGQFSGHPVADFLLGVPYQASGGQTAPPMQRRGIWWDVYVNDDFKVRRDLTLNMGLRYQYTQPLIELNNNIGMLDEKTGQILLAGRDGVSRGLLTPDRNDFGPRLGLAWAPFGSQNWAVRSSYGVFYDRLPGGEWAFQGSTYPFAVSQSFTSDPFVPTIAISSLFPTIDVSNPSKFSGVDLFNLSDRRSPYLQQWTLSIQRALGKETFLEAAYVGSKGTKLSKRVNANNAPLPPPSDTRPLAQRRRYPSWGNILDDKGIGNSMYHGLQLNLRKTYSKGLMFQAGYTWAKSLDNDSFDFKGTRNYHMGDMDKGRSIFDVRQRFVYSMTYELPFGQDLTGVAKQAFHGWNVNTILQIQTGPPFGVGTSADPSMTGVRRGRRPNRICDGNLPPDQRTAERWFDTSCFVLPALRTYGNAGAQILDGPAFKSVDFSLNKRFPFTESKSLEFRAEFFNLFNTVNLSRPENNIQSGSYGIIRTTGPPRNIQLALKFTF